MSIPNPLAASCPCGHAAYQHRSQEQIDRNDAAGKRYVGECTGRANVSGWCCECQVPRAQVIAAAELASS
jgi:hypothetical protein